MKNRRSIIIPILSGITVGGLLFALGESDDAPGLCAIGLSIGYILVMFGINKTGVIRKGLFAPVLLLSFAAFFAIITTSILLDGEFGDRPGYSAIGYLMACVLGLAGILKIRHDSSHSK